MFLVTKAVGPIALHPVEHPVWDPIPCALQELPWPLGAIVGEWTNTPDIHMKRCKQKSCSSQKTALQPQKAAQG